MRVLLLRFVELLVELKDDDTGCDSAECALAVALIGISIILSGKHFLKRSASVLVVLALPDDWDPVSTFNERHFRIKELSENWRVGRETIRLLVKDEPGVVAIRHGRKRAHATYSVPESVAKRIYASLVIKPRVDQQKRLRS
ncbi:MAG: hypothetical protein WB679_17860 [Terracidiphilus sp.]